MFCVDHIFVDSGAGQHSALLADLIVSSQGALMSLLPSRKGGETLGLAEVEPHLCD